MYIFQTYLNLSFKVRCFNYSYTNTSSMVNDFKLVVEIFFSKAVHMKGISAKTKPVWLDILSMCL